MKNNNNEQNKINKFSKPFNINIKNILSKFFKKIKCSLNQ